MLLGSKAHYRLLAAMLAAPLLLGGCSHQVSSLYSKFFPENLPDIPSRLSISQLWETQISSDFSDGYLRLQPLIRKDRIYACGGAGQVAALNIENGDVVWHQPLKSVITAGVGGGDKAIVVGGSHGEILAFSKASGKPLWKQKLSGRITALSESHQGIVIARTLRTIVALKEVTGDLIWRRKLDPPSLTIIGSSVPLFYKDVAFVGLDNGELWIISLKDGTTLRNIKLGVDSGKTSLDRIVDVDGQIAMTDNVLYASAYQGRTVAIDFEQKKLVWTQNIPSQSGLVASKDAVFITTNLNQVTAVDRQTGKQLWINEYPWQAPLGAPSTLNIFIVIGDSEGSLFWLSRKNGQIYQQTELSNDGISGIRTRGRNAYILGNDGSLAAIRLKGYLK